MTRAFGNASRTTSDELRKFHPQFRDIMRTDPLRTAVLTNQAASTWVQGWE